MTGTLRRRRGPAAVAGAAVSATAVIAAAAVLAGCSQPATTAAWITVPSAYVIQPDGPGAIDGYLVIQNMGSADRLIGIRSSAGGTIVLRGPAGPGQGVIRTVSSISIPGHSLVRLDPVGMHLVLTGGTPLRDGNDITLTLVFAHAGTITAVAQVTNPETGGGTYLGN